MYWLRFYKGKKKPPEVHMDSPTLAYVNKMLEEDKSERDYIEVVLHG